MAAAGYRWRQLNQKQRQELLEWRKAPATRGIRLRIGLTLDICDF